MWFSVKLCLNHLNVYLSPVNYQNQTEIDQLDTNDNLVKNLQSRLKFFDVIILYSIDCLNHPMEAI